MLYSTYNLSIESEIDLPELQFATQTDAPPDVNIQLSTLPANGLPEGQQLGPFLWVKQEDLWLQVPQVARFMVQGGHTILVDPEPGIDEDSLRVFLLGSALGALLFQRGYLVLHGNAIRIGDQCMISVGHSGAGKSTLAAGFMQRGFSVLADDVVPINKACQALPGFPRIKLWQDVADKLQIDTSALRRIRPNIEKFNLPLSQPPSAEPVPVRWIYILGSDNIQSFNFSPIHGMQRFLPLYNNTYRVHFMNAMALKSEHMQLCGQLANKIRLANITRPKASFDLDALIDHLLADMAANP